MFLGFVCGVICCDVGTLGQNKAGVWYQSVSCEDEMRSSVMLSEVK